MAPSFDYQRVIDRVDGYIVDRSRLVIGAFLLVSVVFAIGLGGVTTDAGNEAFTQDVPAEQAFQKVNDDFSPAFAADTGGTSLIQRGPNVLGKPALLTMLEVQERSRSHDSLRVTGTASAAAIVAQTLDPTAATPEAQIRGIEGATEAEIDRAVRQAADRPEFTGLVSNDFNRECACASATIGSVSHEVPAGISSGSGQGGSSPLTPIQERMITVVNSVDGGASIQVFGSGIVASEFSNVITDSLIIVTPAAVLFIIVFLVISYRDLADLVLGVVALGMTIVWTFGFMGITGIPFNQILIAVPPLLLAVGIDFGIHAVNRYREETIQGTGIDTAMRTTTDQLLVAFFIVTGTTVIGFSANLLSDLPPIRDFGIVAAVGITFTFLIFGIFLPATKVELDRLRQRYPIPTFATTPLGSEGSLLGSALTGGVPVARRAAVPFLLLVLVVSAGAGVYATGVDTTFTQDDFLPPEENPEYLTALPEPFAPSEYTVTGTTNFLEAKFESASGDQVVVYVEGPLTRDHALEAIHRAGADPPDSFVTVDGRADATSIVTIVQDRADRDPEFARLVARNDADGNGIPDDNLGEVYDYLLTSSSADRASQYITDDYRAAQVQYATESSATQSEITADARQVADEMRFSATATGSTVVFQAISDLILGSAVQSLIAALVGAAIFLVFVYWVIEGKATLGIANLFPIIVSVTLIAGSMRFFGIAFNAFTATILSITIGLGIDYSVHVTHRFADEYKRRPLYEALDRTVRGTGGALAGSMLTTVFGIGTLTLSVFPAIGNFGILTGLSVLYSFLASLFVLPAALAVWARFRGGEGRAETASEEPETPSDGPEGQATPAD